MLTWSRKTSDYSKLNLTLTFFTKFHFYPGFTKTKVFRWRKFSTHSYNIPGIISVGSEPGLCWVNEDQIRPESCQLECVITSSLFNKPSNRAHQSRRLQRRPPRIHTLWYKYKCTSRAHIQNHLRVMNREISGISLIVSHSTCLCDNNYCSSVMTRKNNRLSTIFTLSWKFNILLPLDRVFLCVEYIRSAGCVWGWNRVWLSRGA